MLPYLGRVTFDIIKGKRETLSFLRFLKQKITEGESLMVERLEKEVWIRRGWDAGLDYTETYQKILLHLTKKKKPFDVVLLIQLRNGSRIGEAVESTLKFCESGQNKVLVNIEKHKTNDQRVMVLPEELRNKQGKLLLQGACTRLSELKNPKGAIKVYCERTYKFNSHSLRYAFITHLLKKGVSPSIIAKITGHRSLDHILHYTETKTAEEILSSL